MEGGKLSFLRFVSGVGAASFAVSPAAPRRSQVVEGSGATRRRRRTSAENDWFFLIAARLLRVAAVL